MEGKETYTLRFEDYRGNTQTREVYSHIDVRDFRGTAVYPFLVMAANTHLSSPDLCRVLEMAAETSPTVYRPARWLQKRKWMVMPPGTVAVPSWPDRDGKQAKALAIMAEHPGLSLRDLTKLLKEHGIIRSREFVRKTRYLQTV